MKRIVLFMIFMVSVIDISGMDRPGRLIDELRSGESTEGVKRTSPAKGGTFSPDPSSKRIRKVPTGYSETERESEFERRPVVQIPTLTEIRNNFNYPILVAYHRGVDRTEPFEDVKPGQSSLQKKIRMDGDIMIGANNKNHRIQFMPANNKSYFVVDIIDEGVQREWELTTKHIEIEIDKNGNLHVKSVNP